MQKQWGWYRDSFLLKWLRRPASESEKASGACLEATDRFSMDWTFRIEQRRLIIVRAYKGFLPSGQCAHRIRICISALQPDLCTLPDYRHDSHTTQNNTDAGCVHRFCIRGWLWDFLRSSFSPLNDSKLISGTRILKKIFHTNDRVRPLKSITVS